jgi:glucans biosynthesis protein C
MNKIFYRKPAFSTTAFPSIFKLPAPALTKNENVETLRGLAIILVVFGHMIGYTNTGGMRVSDDSIYRYLYYSLEYVRLPLFTVISGWVYANKPLQDTNRSKFIRGKLRRLIIPMFVISTLLFFFRMVIPGTNTKPEINDLPRNLILPYDVYWYLFSLFIIFLVVTFLDSKPFFHTLEGWFIVLTGAFAFLFISENFLDPVPNLFSFKGAAYLFPFFLTGMGIFRFRDFLLNDRITFGVLLVFVCATIIQQMVWFGYFPQQEKHSLLGMSVGISGVLLLFRLKLKNSFLIWIGGYAYGIFLFHVFFTGGSRILLLKAGIENQAVILVFGVVAAIFLSMLVEVVIKRSQVLRYFFLGLKKSEK